MNDDNILLTCPFCGNHVDDCICDELCPGCERPWEECECND